MIKVWLSWWVSRGGGSFCGNIDWHFNNLSVSHHLSQLVCVKLHHYNYGTTLWSLINQVKSQITWLFPYETSRSVYSLLQICLHICSRSADNLQMIYRLSAECLQNVCRISAEYLQNVCRASAAMICNKSANLQTLCRRNQPIMLNKKPTKCTNQTTFI